MLRHLFKLIWNKRTKFFINNRNACFVHCHLRRVYTACLFYQNYKQPLGFDYENVWVVKFEKPPNIKSNDSLKSYFETVSNLLHSMPQIKYAAFESGNYPFSPSTNNNSVNYNKNNTVSNFYVVQDDYANALNLKMIEGRWFNKTDEAYKDKPVVINET